MTCHGSCSQLPAYVPRDPGDPVLNRQPDDALIVAIERLELEQRKVAVLREALEKYGEHLSDWRADRCGKQGAVCELVRVQSWSQDDPKPKCTCGFDEALRATT